MGAPDVLARLAAAGLTLTPVPPDRLAIAPRDRITDDLRALVRGNKPALLAHLLRRERMAEQAAVKLRDQPGLRRAAVMEPDGPGRYLAAVAVRMADEIATAIIADIRTDDGLLLLTAMDRACAAPVQ
jgi:hypothetical protein